MKKLFTFLVVISSFSEANAQITLDGNITESAWGSFLANSAGGPTPSFGAGHEINAIYATSATTSTIYIAVAGNVQNTNRILVFLDTKPGGYNTGNFGRALAPNGINNFAPGSKFDVGFSPDYCLVIGTNAALDNYFFDLYTLTGTFGTGGGGNSYLGDKSVMGANPLNSSITRGFEVKILKTALDYDGNGIKMMAMYTAESGFLSNQFLTRGNSNDGSYGSGSVDFSTATPNFVTALPSVLPLNIQSFTASKKENITNLLWQTAFEKDNAIFKIERSPNAMDFSSIGEVTGSGNSTAIKNYTFTDVAPLSGVNYYRLKAVDYTGAATLSKVVSVKFSGKNDGIVAVYPNPTRNVLRVDVNVTEPTTTLIQVTDLAGRIVLSQSVTVIKGANLLTVNVATLPSGTYLVKMNGETTRFVKQ